MLDCHRCSVVPVFSLPRRLFPGLPRIVWSPGIYFHVWSLAEDPKYKFFQTENGLHSKNCLSPDPEPERQNSVIIVLGHIVQ